MDEERAAAERRNESNRRWQAKHPEKVREYRLRYEAKYPERVKERRRRYREVIMADPVSHAAHKAAMRVYGRRWREAHPEKAREAQREANARYRAKKKVERDGQVSDHS